MTADRLTDAQLRKMHHEDQFGLFCDYDDFEQIARAVEQAIRNLLDDQTDDNAVCMVRAICEAAADRLVAPTYKPRVWGDLESEMRRAFGLQADPRPSQDTP